MGNSNGRRVISPTEGMTQIQAATQRAASAVARYRRAHGDERLQMKWLAYAAFFLPFAAAAAFSGLPYGPVALVACGLFAAAAVAIAILRYRLYEIDIIINRTLVYGALSAVLAGVYTASITLSQRLFMAVTGERSDAAIVLTTLIVAATFTPLKSRLQASVDARIKAAPPGGAMAAPAAAMTDVLDTVEDRLRRIVREEIALTARGDAPRSG